MSTDALFSADWYRVSDLMPWVASDVVAHRHVYRGQPGYVLQSRSSGKHFRVDIATYELIHALNGRVSVDEVWRNGLERYDTDAPTQDEFLILLADLHHAEVISVGRRLDTDTLFGRREASKKTDRRARYSNPLYLRFSLFDPDAILTKIEPYLAWLCTRTAAFVWLAIMILTAAALAPDLGDLVREIDRSTFTEPSTLVIAILLWPLLKCLHEFAHGLAVKHRGGEVHEMGVAVMVLFPIPYVDASASSVFPNKWHRIFVSAAGIFMDMTLCAFALLVWSTSNGLVHDISMVVVLMTGLSTLLFNGNPLLKFDGYYVLADLLEIPNLAERSSKYLKGLFSNQLFQIPNTVKPVDNKEAWWLVGYGVTAAVYRFFLTLFIAWMLSARMLTIGVLLAVYAIVASIVWPFVRSVSRMWRNPDVSRTRILGFGSVIPLAVFVFLGVIPVAADRTVKGVVWLPDDSIVRVDSECEVTNVNVLNGEHVNTGDVLFQCHNPMIDQNARILLAERDELKAKQSGLLARDTSKYQQIKQELAANGTRLVDAINRRNALIVRAASSGQFVLDGEFELSGQLLAAGSLAAYVIPDTQDRTVRLALSENTSDAKLDWQEIKVRAPGETGVVKSHLSKVTHLSTAATYAVPSPALTVLGGGNLAASMVDKRVQLDSPAFDVEIAWPETATPLPIGSHVLVKLSRDSEPLGAQWLRRWQRAFLGRVRT